jgi:hypothetical protein
MPNAIIYGKENQSDVENVSHLIPTYADSDIKAITVQRHQPENVHNF